MPSGTGDAASTYERGVELADTGQLEEAEAAFREADEQGHPTAATAIGMLSEHRGEMAAAEEAYRRADERGDGYGAFRLGTLLSSAGDWEAAQVAWARADERGHESEAHALDALLRGRRRIDEGPRRVASERSAFSNPVLVGAVTLLVTMVAVFLSYNANAGLPFVPTRELHVDVADGSNLVPGNDVREGGFRIGLVSSMKPVHLRSGGTAAELTLKLNQSDGSIPVDSRVTVQPRSVLGLKYVDLVRGHSRRLFPDGGTMPISRTAVPVQFDDVFKTFDSRTRDAIQRDLAGYGNVFAGRGGALNDTIHSLPELLGHLRVVAGYLSDRRTRLVPFFDSLERFMGAVAPVAGTNARLFGDMATTFAAIDRDPSTYRQTIAESPSTLDVSTSSLAVQRPFLVDLARFGRFMIPATRSLKLALPAINPALEDGSRVLRRTPPLNSRLQGVMNALRSLARAPGTNVALNALTGTVDTLNPMVRYLGPYQTVCDYWDYWWTFLSEHLSEQTNVGFAQRALLNFTDGQQRDNVGQQGATQPAGTFGGPEFLHNPNYGSAIDTHGNADCETGQRGYPLKLNYMDPQHRNLATDQHTPGDQGPTFHGRARVPKRETFTRNPTTGPKLAYDPTNP